MLLDIQLDLIGRSQELFTNDIKTWGNELKDIVEKSLLKLD